MEERILYHVILNKDRHVMENAKHYSNGDLLPRPTALSIAEYIGGSGGFYLFYLDETGKEQTDTFHDTLEQAFNQAEFEFNIKKNEWEKLAESYQVSA